MTLYDVEVIKTPASAKALKLISAIAGIGERELKVKLRNPPLVIKGAIPLFEAVAIERQLNILGIATRLVRVEVEVDTEKPEELDAPTSEPKEEIIEIPDDEIKVLPSFGSTDDKHTIKFKRKKSPVGGNRFNWLLLVTSIAVFSLICWLLYIATSRKTNETELKMYLDQWQTTLQQQDLLLDNGFPPDRILYKLDEIKGKLNHLLSLVKSQKKSTELRSKFVQNQVKSESLVKDLIFRKSLEDHGYPIHPTCMVDRGMVRGTSDLPEATLLRIQLFRQNNLESLHYAARVSAGLFKLLIDPSIERNVYDARATVASYSQQPKEIQLWAERKFALTELSRQILPSTRTPSSISGRITTPSKPPQAPMLSSTEGDLPLKSNIPLADPGNDKARAQELERTLEAWTATMLSVQQQKLTIESSPLEQIYNRLLDLEVRIDQLIGLMESSVQQNLWIERREDVYGSFIDLRQEISELYNIHSKRGNPIKLEEALHRNLGNKGFRNAKSLVIDSPQNLGFYIIEFEVDQGQRDDVLIAMAQALNEELKGLNLQLERISLKHDDKTYWWTPAQIRKGIEALEYPEGPRRCAALLYLSSSTSTPK